MPQAFLLQMIPAMEQAVTLTVPLGILLAILFSIQNETARKTMKKALKWGFWISVFITAAKTGTKQAVSREVFEGMAIFAAVAAEIILVVLLTRGKTGADGSGKLFRYSVFTTTFALFLYHGLEIWLIPVNIVSAALGEYFTMEFLVKSLGYLVGIFLGFLSGYLTYKASSALNFRRLLFVFLVQLAAALFEQLVFLIQVLMARQVISSAQLLRTMAPLIDHASWAIFIIYIVTILVPITLFLQPKPAKPEGANPAQYRQILANAKHKKRWGTGVVLAVIVMFFISSFGSAFANKKEELVPAVPVKAENGFVNLDLAEVGDGHLHRYAYRAKDGTTVRVIIIQKGGNAYGVGLDACDVCGPTGYYEKDNQVICKLCNVIMNKQTIGMPGGCNPVPVKYTVENGSVRIAAEILEKERIRFR